jgi:hypothetical protein
VTQRVRPEANMLLQWARLCQLWRRAGVVEGES